GRRGHHRLRPDALLPPAQPGVAGAREPRDLRAPDEARPARDRGAGALRGLRDPEPLRDRVRPGLRRALPEFALRRRPPPRSDAGRGLAARVAAGLCRYPGKPPLGYSESTVNRFFRSAFFPLIVIVVLVWLASQ